MRHGTFFVHTAVLTVGVSTPVLVVVPAYLLAPWVLGACGGCSSWQPLVGGTLVQPEWIHGACGTQMGLIQTMLAVRYGLGSTCEGLTVET